MAMKVYYDKEKGRLVYIGESVNSFWCRAHDISGSQEHKKGFLEDRMLNNPKTWLLTVRHLIGRILFAKSVWKLIRYLSIAVGAYSQFTREITSALSYKWSLPNDGDYLRTTIKKRAHNVEKFIIMPAEHVDNHTCDLIAAQLEEAISEWKKRKYEDAPFLKWAEKISGEYRELFKNSKPCPMIGKPKEAGERDFVQVLKSRRSIRVFQTKKLGEETLEQLIEAAKWAPTACNRQGLRFLFVMDDGLKKIVSSTISGGHEFAHNAPVLLLVLADKRDYRYPDERFTPYQDAAAAIQNLLLMAEHLGIGACWCTYTSYSSVQREGEIRTLLHIPDHMLICGAVPLGWPGQNMCVVPRDENSQLYSIDQFGEGNEGTS